VLFDEAQLFFAMRSAIPLGDLIKDRLERHWSHRTDAFVPVMFGFIGLPTLHTRAGANLNGLLRPISYNELEEGELNGLILAVTTDSLSTTREARRRLARTAGNIYILRTLVDRLAEHVQKDGRCWLTTMMSCWLKSLSARVYAKERRRSYRFIFVTSLTTPRTSVYGSRMLQYHLRSP